MYTITTLVIALITLYYGARGAADFRQTVIKAGYGVNYELVDHVFVEGGTSFYAHTWLVDWPVVSRLTPLGYLDCSQAVDWAKRCRAINRMITEINTSVYESLSLVQRRLDVSAQQLPPAMMDDILAFSSMAVPDRKRRAAHADRPDANLPAWLKEQPEDTVMEWLPTYTIGRIWSDLTGSPGPDDIHRLKSHLRSVGSAVYENIRGIQQFEDDVSSLSVLTSIRIDELVHAGNITDTRIRETRDGIRHFYTRSEDAAQELNNRADHVNAIDRTVLTRLAPSILQYRRRVAQYINTLENFMMGITQLTRGYMSPFLVNEEAVQEVTNHVRDNVLSKSRYADLHLPSTAISYYYQLKTVTYTHVLGNDTGSYLAISLRIPMHLAGGLLPVYRIDTYPVPVRAGLTITGDSAVGDYTHLMGMPDFIAISTDLSTYIELEKRLFLTCSGRRHARVCGPGMEAIRSRSSNKRSTCAFAVFVEHTQDIMPLCDFRYTTLDQWRPYGTAIQMTADMTFLMHQSRRDRDRSDVWEMACPQSSARPFSTVEPCDMCRIKVPCFCSLVGVDFHLASRSSGCLETEAGSDDQTSYIYHTNAIMTKTLFPQSAAAALLSQETLLERIHPPFTFPDIAFHVEDNLTAYIDLSDQFSASLGKTLENQKAELALYTTKEDAALNRTRDMSDQVAWRTTDIGKAVKDFFMSFGGNFWAVGGILFSPLFMVCAAFVLSAIDFIPTAVAFVRARKLKGKRDREHKYAMCVLMTRFAEMSEGYAE